MAEKVTIKGGDLDGSQLENAASEATLLLLKEAMEKLAKQSGPNSGGANRGLRDLADAADDTAEEVEDLGDSIGILSASVSALGFAFTGIISVIGGLGSVVGKGVGAFAEFTETMVTSQPNITDFTGALANSRLNILGLGTAVDVLAKIIYGNYTTFQDLSKSGIMLGDMVGDLSDMYAGSGQTLDQMAGHIAANSEQLAMLGTASRGARLAMDLNRKSFDRNKNALLSWGMNFSEQGETFTEFLAQNSIALRRRTVTEADVMNMSQSYAVNLRKLSELTGKSVDDLQGELEKANMHKGFEAFISGIDDPALQDRYKRLIEEYGATFGDSGRELAMATIMGVAPITEGSQKMAAIMPDIQTALESQKQSAQSFSGSTDDFMGTVRKQNHNLATSLQSWIDENAELAAVLSMKGGPIGDAFNEIIRGLNIYSGDIDSLGGKLDPAAEAAASFDVATQSLREAMSEMVTTFFGNQAVKDGLTAMAEWLKEFDPTKYNPFDEAGRQNIYDSFWKGIERASTAISEWWNGPQGQKIEETLTFYFERVMFRLMEALNNIPGLNLMVDNETIEKDRIRLGLGSEGETNLFIREQEQKLESLRAELSSLEAYQQNYDPSNIDSMDYSADISLRQAELNETIALLAEIAELQAQQNANSRTSEPQAGRNQFATGTYGFENFGEKSVAELHGVEAVVPRNTDAGEYLDNFFTKDWKLKDFTKNSLSKNTDTTDLRKIINEVFENKSSLTGTTPTTQNEMFGAAFSSQNQGKDQTDLIKKLDELNTTMIKAVELLEDTANFTRATSRSIKTLGTDAMRGVGR